MRPLSEALSDLGRLANRHHEVVAGVTYEKVTQMMSSLAGRSFPSRGHFLLTVKQTKEPLEFG